MPEETKDKAQQAPPKDKMVRVTVGKQPVAEGGTIHPAGGVAEIPAKRVKALGALVSTK